MPLFSHKHKEDRAMDRDVHDKHNRNTLTGPGNHANPTAPGITGPTATTHPAGAAGVGSAGAAYGGTQGYNTDLGVNQHQQPYGINSTDPNIVPTNHFNSGQNSGGGSRMAGKMEHAVGTLVGSESLKVKGMQKEQEAQAFKMQSAEIAEAERLEKEAMLRRERAVQHGAHPHNKPLGGAQGLTNNQGLNPTQDLNQPNTRNPGLSGQGGPIY
ncbi:hypothetical protein BXZ70DRAFT_928027 [Cristinia sonorae]|uniref:Uncharacterized protein n=1 Tax=Cristinia sonorae TaxID=1940300 RepID=A0A8K0UUY0_9AGAR|nr:hypothetical protein BXZ70DRAFT_928027 [Cristinia sonorae]